MANKRLTLLLASAAISLFNGMSILETKTGFGKPIKKSVVCGPGSVHPRFQTLNTGVPFAHKEGASVTRIIRSTERY